MAKIEGLILPANQQEIIDPFASFKANVEKAVLGQPLPQGVRHTVEAHSPGHIAGTLLRRKSRLSYEAKDLDHFTDDKGRLTFETEEETLTKICLSSVSGDADITRTELLEIIGTRLPEDETGTLIALSALRKATATREISSDTEGTVIEQRFDQSIDIFDLADLRQRLRWSLGKVAAFLDHTTE